MSEGETFVKIIRLIISTVGAVGLYYVWIEFRGDLDEWYVPLIASIFIFILLYVVLKRMKD